MNPTSQLPKDRQKVLIDIGATFEPAMYNTKLGTFERYDNCIPGDRCITYFYSGVLAWLPFPEHSRRQGFIAEPEKAPISKDITEPITPQETENLFDYEQYHRELPEKDSLPVEMQVALCIPPIM